MGQRHQAFLVARVIPYKANVARYRCIGALHHQWCYGTLPLRAIGRFLDLIKVPQNAEIVSEELKHLNGKYGAKMAEEPRIPNVPCPYTYLLLSNAFSVEREDPEQFGISRIIDLSASMGSFDGDYEDGITVLDVTDPLRPAYTLVTDPSHPVCETASSYLRQYYPEDQDHGMDKSILLNVVSKLQGERRVGLDILREAWPKDYSGKVKVVDEEEFNELADTPLEEPKNSVPTLVDMTIQSALHQALEEGSVMKLEHFVETPSTAKIMKECLRKVPFTFGAAHLMSLLVEREAHSPESIVDLSGFPICTTENFLAMLPPSVLRVDTLILSHNPQLVIDTIQSILEKLPKIRRLVILHTGVTNEDLRSLLRSQPQLFYHIESLVHPLCLTDAAGPNHTSPSSVPAPRYPYQFTCLVGGESSYSFGGGSVAASLATFTLPKIVQVLADFLVPLTHKTFGVCDAVSDEVAMQGIFGSESRRAERWGKRVIGVVPDISTQFIQHHDHGDGWIFSIRIASPYAFLMPVPMPDASSLGFFRRRRRSNEGLTGTQAETEEVVYEPHTLQSFLSTCEREGRTPAPSEDVARLQDMLDFLMGTLQRQPGWKQMPLETLLSMIGS